MNRRHAIVAAAGAVGVATGVGTAIWRSRRDHDRDVGGGDETPSPSPDIWSMSFARIDGGAVALASLRGRPLLLNFWATWCGPCVVEMPLLDAFRLDPRRSAWQVLALAVDEPDPVRRFVSQHRLGIPVALAGADGLDLSRRLGNLAGALPFSVAFAATGAAIERRLGAMTRPLLDEWATKVQ